MTYSKPKLLVLGDASRVIEQSAPCSQKSHAQSDGKTSCGTNFGAAPAYDLDE